MDVGLCCILRQSYWQVNSSFEEKADPFQLSLCVNMSFSTSRKSNPELQGELGELRKHLLESTNDMTPLKVWELQGGQAAIIDGPIVQLVWCPARLNRSSWVGENCPFDELGSSEKVAVCTPFLVHRSVLLLFGLFNTIS